MTDAELFDSAVAAAGLGRLAQFPAGHPGAAGYDHIRHLAQELIDSARAHVSELPPIHLNFIANGGVNAFAFRNDGQYFIGITTGTIFMLEFLFMRMLSDRRLFSTIGRPDGEESGLPPLTCCLPQAEAMVSAGYIAAPPRTTERHLYARTLLEQGLLFLVGHEIAHVTLGHVDYLESKTGNAMVSELVATSPGSEDLLERQCMEAQADMRSAFSRISSIKLARDEGKPLTAPWSARPLTDADLVFLWSFAMNTIFRLFGDGRFDPSQLPNMAYPPLALRRLIASNAALSAVVQNWEAALEQDAANALRSALQYTEHVFGLLLGEEATLENLRGALNPAAKEHYERLTAYFESLRERLAPFAYESTAVVSSSQG